ncbi:aldo/keto reductase [Ruminococcaceae bacterium OttesenSCG-928-I18]|nr:aldo/keto reductase [Ruminococcaceae bacterium OttesenSCG-928-I18]
MKTVALGPNKIPVPAIIQGLMRIEKMSETEVKALLDNCLENGTNFLDTANCYGDYEGQCEEILGNTFKANPGLRDKFILQSKGGITFYEDGRPYHNYSKEHLMKTLDASLQRLQTDHLDYFLLHRHDALFRPEEVADAFATMKKQGKVLHFGISNEVPMVIELIQKYSDIPIEVNQMQFSIVHADMCVQPIATNNHEFYAADRDCSILPYCRLKDITIQAWSPFQHGFIEGVFLDNPDYKEVNEAMQKVADKYGVSKTTIAVAWILRHPADMQVVCGTTNASRFADCCKASDIELTYEDWYNIYLAAGYPIM